MPHGPRELLPKRIFWATARYECQRHRLLPQHACPSTSVLLRAALDNYFDAFETGFGKNLSANEKADPFWVKKAGLQALPLIQSLGVAPPENFIDEMEQLLPQLKDSLEKKRAEFSQIKS